MWAYRRTSISIAFFAFLFFTPGCRSGAGDGRLADDRALEVRCLEALATALDPATQFLNLAIAEAARDHGVDADLIRAIIQTESEFDRLAVSSRGACGLMQLMPVTTRRFGVRDCFDPRENIRGGTSFLKVLLTRYQGSIPLSIAAYNAGEGAVARHRGIPPYRQTRAYVRRVQALVSDGGTARPKART